MLKSLMIGLLSLQGLFGALLADDSQNAEISKNVAVFSKAFNEGDANLVSSFWTEDAEFAIPTTGEVIDGKAAIGQYFQKRLQEMKQRGLHFTFKANKISVIDPEHALVQGLSEMTDKSGALIQRNAREIELVKQNGKWLIDEVSDIEVAPAPPLYAHLKELGWLVGKWQDKDDNVDITFVNDWDKFKNFLKSHFKMEVYGQEAIEGVQLIGWDPIANQIRSWVFDSDGGTGTGLWSKAGDSWQVAMNFVLSDGKKASSTNIYTKINDTSYSFSSKDRKINGEAIADVEPVTVVKEES